MIEDCKNDLSNLHPYPDMMKDDLGNLHLYPDTLHTLHTLLMVRLSTCTKVLGGIRNGSHCHLSTKHTLPPINPCTCK